MKQLICSLLIISLLFSKADAQSIGIGTTTPNASALLELQSANKGLLLPRVADTSSVSSPAKGLLVYANANNKVWFYDGSRWLQATGTGSTDANWQLKGDSLLYTTKKYLSINADSSTSLSQQGLQVNGSLVIQQPFFQKSTAPTPSQTFVMDNTPFPQAYQVTDSSGRVFDPGGPGINYLNNVQGNVDIPNHPFMTGITFSFNNADFRLAAGDTLWISNSYFPLCRTDYYYRATSNTMTGETFSITTPNSSAKIIFRSNSDNLNAAGFDITWKRNFSTEGEKAITTSGNSLVFNSSNGVFGAGFHTLTNAGRNSTLLGYNVTATGSYATAIGRLSSATADNAVAIGYGAVASEYAAMAFGFGATANGNTSIAFGERTNASGAFATAFGSNTNASAYLSTAFGRYNDSISFSNKTSWVATDPLFYIGNGTSDNRNNALVIYKNGNADINGYTRLGELSNGAPRIKTKKLTGTSSNAQGGLATITHNLTRSKILGVQVLLTYDIAGGEIPGSYLDVPGFEYNWQVTGTAINIYNKNGNSVNILNKPIKILITYEE